MKLARKIVGWLLGMTLVLIAVIGFFDIRREVRDYEARTATELRIAGRSLRPLFDSVWDVEGEGRARQLLDHTDLTIEETNFRWAPLNGAGTGASNVALTADQGAALARGEAVDVKRPVSDVDRLYVYVPTHGGAIELSQPLSARPTIIWQVVTERSLAAVIAILGAASLAAVAGVFLVGRPVTELVEQVRRIGAGDLARRERPAERRDELGELAAAMDDMSARLSEARTRVAAEAETRIKAVEQLRHADRLSTVGTLASGIAHELGTPLSVIAGHAKTLSTEAPARDEPRVILRQTERMTKIIRGLLDFARRKAANKLATDVNEIAARTIDLMTPLARKKQIDLRLDAHANALLAHVDAIQIEQALANLVTNAVHATASPGEVVVGTRVASRRPSRAPDGEAGEGRYIELFVRDHGAGIAPEDRPRIFEPFFTTKDVGEGTGLGLSVTLGIMEDHAGFIDVESEPGEGSCFSLYFPCAAGTPGSAATA